MTFELTGVTTGDPASPVLRGVTVALPHDGITVLAGPSGAGKTSLLRLLNRLDDPTEGEVRWNGADLTSLRPSELRRRVGMVFQRAPLFAGTVLDNLRVADASLRREEAVDALARVGLDDGVLDRAAVDLSGGEAQRMCFARALLTDPDVLLADEPTASLDARARRAVEELARDLADAGMPMIWVSHDVDQLRRLADHVVVMSAGRVVATGAPRQLADHDDPVVRDAVGAA